jgi:hypothetical protein
LVVTEEVTKLAEGSEVLGRQIYVKQKATMTENGSDEEGEDKGWAGEELEIY